MSSRHRTDVLILGAGLTGLAAASALGDRATVLEREARPGGLVRTEKFGAYWFDHVVHLLYFPDAATEARVKALVGEDLQPCPPVAWVESLAGVTRFPFQMHLGALPPDVVVGCLTDLARVTFGPRDDAAIENFEQMLLRTFGRGMCDAFLLPYNRKMWRRPLDGLLPGGFTWNITRPDFAGVVRGALAGGAEFAAYNSAGWYPRPPAGAPARGMEVLSRALAGAAADLRLRHTVTAIDLDRRRLTARDADGLEGVFEYGQACLSTLPLPALLGLCRQAPADLREACGRLTRNRVWSVAVSVRGPRPVGRGHWRYYADESVCFTRLIYMHEFDPLMAPPDGWGLLVEVTDPAEAPVPEAGELTGRVRADLSKVGALPEGCEVVDERVILVDPAYVVFTRDNRRIVEEAHGFLRRYGVESLGRYGRWEYSSMGQVMRDGFAWAEGLKGRGGGGAASRAGVEA